MRLVLHPNTPEQHSVEIERGAATIGRAADNVIVIDDHDAAQYHALIQAEGGGWMLHDLAGRNDVLLDGQPVSAAKLSLGSRIRIGSTDLLVIALGRPESEVVRVAPVIEATMTDTVPRSAMTSTQTTRLCSVCGAAMQADTRFCGRCGAISAPRPYHGTSTGVLARLALLFALCGPLLLGIGWILGGLMGFVSLIRHQRSGGRPSDREIAWWAVLVSLMWLMVIGGGAAWFGWRYAIGLRVQSAQENTEALLAAIARAEYYVKYSGYQDSDRDGVSEYVRFDKLARSGYPLPVDNLNEMPLHFGYYFTMLRADETGFACSAVPKPYRISGIYSYLVDENGLLYRADLHGRALELAPTGSAALAAVDIRATCNGELAGDLAAAAEAALQNKQFARCTQIVANIRLAFSNAPVVQRLGPIEEKAVAFLDEAEADRLYTQADDLISRAQADKAIELLRTITSRFTNVPIATLARRRVIGLTESNAWQQAAGLDALIAATNANQAAALIAQVRQAFPEASGSPPLSQSLKAVEAKLMVFLEIEATNMVGQARAKEAAGDYEGAYVQYLSVKTRFGQTKAAQGIDEVIARNRGLVLEHEAAKLVDDIAQLAPATNTFRILDLLELLKRGYAQTEKFKQHEQMLKTLEQECQTLKFVSAARAHLGQKSYRAALTSIDQAITNNPNLAHMLKEEREQCYLGLGDAAYESQDYIKALEHYQHYLKLQPKDSRIDTTRFLECNYQAAKARIQHRDFADAEQFLVACASQYDRDAEFSFLYGYVLMNLGRWQEAMRLLTRSIETSLPHAREARIYLGYCQYQLALRQDETIRIMVVGDEDLARLMRDYTITFRIGERTNLPSTIIAATKSAGGKTFLDLTLDTCVALDNISVEMDRLNTIPKKLNEVIRSPHGTLNEAWSVQWGKIRTLSQDIPNQLNILRASASADAFRKQRIAQEIAALRKLYADFGQTLGPVIEKSRNRELAKVSTSLGDKLMVLKAADESFSSYTALEEQRRHSIVSLIQSLATVFKSGSSGPTFVMQKAGEIRAIYESTKETEMAIRALRALADAYSTVPPVSSIMLADPATSETMRFLFDNPATKIPVSLDPIIAK